jgi:uncharacterized membrane protein YjjP (DUF1212 family)
MKPQLSPTDMSEIIDVALFAGQLLLQYGAETARIEETVHRIGTALGCDWMDVLISPNAIIATTVSGSEFRTKVRRVVTLSVNMATVAAVNDLSRAVEAGTINREQARTELARISRLPRYNHWLVALMVGLACASYSRLFGGDWYAFGISFGAASIATMLRQLLMLRHFNTQLIVVATAFVAGLLASLAVRSGLSATPGPALSAAVILLVPGVHMINAVEDLIKGHVMTGVARGVIAALIIAGIALGLLLAMGLAGVTDL